MDSDGDLVAMGQLVVGGDNGDLVWIVIVIWWEWINWCLVEMKKVIWWGWDLPGAISVW